LRSLRELQQRLRSPGAVAWETDLDPRSELSTTTVFQRLPDGRVATYVREWGVAVHRQTWESEEAAVTGVAGRLLGTRPDPRTPRAYVGPTPTNVEDLKDARAELGLDPDQVTRKELLHWAGAGDDVTIVETRDDGSVRTFRRERGQDRDPQDWPDEAAAVADLSWSLEHRNGRLATDLDVERMRARARRMREIMQTHGGRR
jgi:hypothetical protein